MLYIACELEISCTRLFGDSSLLWKTSDELNKFSKCIVSRFVWKRCFLQKIEPC
uniref:Uncharacterized protein n=1 Tax=Arundo donax TaxID=35708 RepID=A0A0A9DLS8_ARUDO